MPKRDANGEWRRFYNEELHSLFRSPNVVRVIKSKRLRWAIHVARKEECRSTLKIVTAKPTGKRLGWAIHVARMEECRNTFKIVTSKHTGKRPSAKPRRRWEDNIRNDLK